MPRGFATVISEETIQKVKEMHSNGVWRKQIAKELQISYTKVCNILNPRKEKVVITSSILAQIENEINTTTPKVLSDKYNRTIGEMRSLLKTLGWKLPITWEETDSNEFKEQIMKCLDCNMSFKDIGDKLGLDRNKIYYICKKLNIEKKPKIKEVIPQTPETVTKTYQEILRETADSIRDKLRKQFA